jgi:hypothetical protein
MADTFSDQDKATGRRPAPTIEGTATEVSVEPQPAAAASAGVGPKGDTAPKERSAGDGGSAQRAGGPVPQLPASLADLKRFLTHMAAGLLGGLVGVLALALALAWGWRPDGAPQSTAPDLSGLEQRLAALEGRQPEAPQDLTELTGRVERLDESLKSLAQSAANGGSVADAAALNAQIAEAEQRLQTRIDAALEAGQGANTGALDALGREVADLKARIGALAAIGASPDGASLQAEITVLNDRIGQLEAALPALAASIDKDATQVKGTAVALALTNLRDAVAAGRPYAGELSTLRALVPTEGLLDALTAQADAGIPTTADLARSFLTASDAALATEAAPADGTLLGSMLDSAKSLVTIRRVDATATGDTPGAILARAEAQLKQGDLALAVKEVEALQGPPRDALQSWLDQAHARLAADDTLNRLEGTLLASIGATPAPTATPAQP